MNILPNLDNLKELTISYCENLEDDFLDMISTISPKFRKLCLRKLRNISEECFIRFFSFANLEGLEKLDFYDAPKLNDKAIINISLIKQLKYLDISWCETVSNETLKTVLISCNFLTKICLQGCKSLDDNLFNNLFFNESDKEIKTHLENISFIDLTKCDYVTDQLISSIYDKYPNITIINYYGRDLRDDFYFYFFYYFLYYIYLIFKIVLYLKNKNIPLFKIFFKYSFIILIFLNSILLIIYIH